MYNFRPNFTQIENFLQRPFIQEVFLRDKYKSLQETLMILYDEQQTESNPSVAASDTKDAKETSTASANTSYQLMTADDKDQQKTTALKTNIAKAEQLLQRAAEILSCVDSKIIGNTTQFLRQLKGTPVVLDREAKIEVVSERTPVKLRDFQQSDNAIMNFFAGLNLPKSKPQPQPASSYHLDIKHSVHPSHTTAAVPPVVVDTHVTTSESKQHGHMNLLRMIFEYMPVRSRAVTARVSKGWRDAVYTSNVHEPFVNRASTSLGVLLINTSVLFTSDDDKAITNLPAASPQKSRNGYGSYGKFQSKIKPELQKALPELKEEAVSHKETEIHRQESTVCCRDRSCLSRIGRTLFYSVPTGGILMWAIGSNKGDKSVADTGIGICVASALILLIYAIVFLKNRCQDIKQEVNTEYIRLQSDGKHSSIPPQRL
jgi:hypothetical protein